LPRSSTFKAISMLALIWVGCGGAPQKPELMARLTKDEITVTGLRAIDYEFASRFSQLVARCADEILQTTDDPETRRLALLWRMSASPQARTAAFNQDPLAGLIELWALAGQQEAYFVEGDGKGAFGEGHPCVVATAVELNQEAEELAAKTISAAEFEQISERVAAWVAGHPIEGRFHVRPTAQADLAGLVGSQAKGGLQAVGSMEEIVRDLNDRIAILSVQLPTEARWQADYLVNALFEEYVADPSEAVVEAVDGVTSFLDDFETKLGRQTTRILEGITAEREAVFAAVGEERALVLEALEGERVAVLDSVDAEVDEALGRVEATGRSLIDHFFERLIWVLVAIGIFILIVGAVLIGALRTSKRVPVPPQPDTTRTDEN